MENKTGLTLLLFLTSLFIIPLPTYAQIEIPQDTILVFIHKSKDKQKFIKQNKKITYWVKGDKSKNKGRIEQITEEGIVINGTSISFDSLTKIGAKSTGLKIVQTTGKVLLISGTLVTGYGAYLVIHGYSIVNSDACGAFILVIMGVTIMSVGIPIAIIGAIPLAIVGQRFDLEKKWNVKMEIVPDKNYLKQKKKEERKNR
ncbi:MAG: hypothetical protein GX437_03875 [Sphingobacteriales bacterium]|nr:hypothetical protein [Sphingobacteriales bacterium]